MGWRGEHIGPAGTSSGVMFAAWEDAADWLRAMMEIWRPEGVGAWNGAILGRSLDGS